MREILRNSLFLISTLCFSKLLCGQSYDVELHAKILTAEQSFTILSSSEASLLVNKSILIKDKKADEGLKGLSLYYDDFHSIEFAEVLVIDPITKKEIEKYKLKDFEDVNFDFSNLATDSRNKILKPSINHFPYELKISYLLKYTGLLFYPVWYENIYTNTEVVKSTFKVIDYTKSTLRYFSVNIQEPIIEKDEAFWTYTWQAENIEPKAFEKLGSLLTDYTGYLVTAPRNFEIDGFAGNMDSWLEFGNWILQLNKSQNDLDMTLLTSLSNQIDTLQNKEDKIKAVYHYLQSNSRYISIQLGIGGWQPLSTAFVHEKKYGDCKALTFYTKALLEYYGIESYYTLITGGKKNPIIRADFPSPHFNHAILTVPINKDTVFLECTSQTNPFGYMGTFTSDRPALLVKENGSKLIQTKKYYPESNIQISNINIKLLENGAARVLSNVTYKGLEIENHGFLNLYQKDSLERYNWYADRIKHSSKEIEKLQLKPLKPGFLPVGGFISKMNVIKEVKRMGKRMFISPSNYVNNYLYNLPDNPNRKASINIRYGYNQFDSLFYELPNNYIIESGRRTVYIDSEYGTYERKIEIVNNNLIYFRSFLLKDGNYPAIKYNDFKDFVDEVNKADSEKIVLLNKT